MKRSEAEYIIDTVLWLNNIQNAPEGPTLAEQIIEALNLGWDAENE